MFIRGFRGARPVHRDVTIIGAGPAGSIAAYLMSRAGWDVTLVEQSRFPRDKVCGESLSALGIDVLTRAGLADRLRALRPAILTRTALHAPDGRSATFPLPRPMWGLSRRAMDATLLDAARETGARVLQPARCEEINGALTVRNLVTNTVERLRPTWTLLADGKGALLPTRPRPTGDLGIKAHFKGVHAPREAVQLFGVIGHYVGVAPVEAGRWNVAFSVPAHRLGSFRGDLDALWRQLLRENPSLASQFAAAVRTGDWLASPLPRFAVARDWPPNLIPLGNAAAAIEPIGGEGMGLALRSAELAAAALEDPAPHHHLPRAFQTLWRRRRWGCRALARLLSTPTLAGTALEWGGDNPLLSRAVLWLVGKG